MKIKQSILCFLTAAIFSALLFSSAQATAAISLALSNTTGDAVQVSVTGAASSNIQLSFLPPGASTVTTLAFGTTNESGNFSTSISSGGYGIPSGSPVFVAIGGIQSATMLWPAYISSLSLTKTSVQVAVGQSIAVGASSAIILSANSLSANIATSVAGSQITITGIKAGSGTVTVCGANLGCGSIAVDVGGEGQSQISFSQNNIIVNIGRSVSVTIMGGGRNGYTVTANSNSTALYTSISGGSSILWLFGNATPGTAIVTVCSAESITNCSNLNVTVRDEASDALSFSQNNILLIPGLTQSSTVSGGPNNNYYIFSNSNSGAAQATISGNIITLVGGSNSGSAVISVCSTSVSNTCGSLNTTLSNNSTSPSATVLAFSQNIVSVAQGDTSSVTVTGGNNTGYVISSNSNPGIATASINGASFVITLYGNAIGSTIIAVCSASVGTTCASLYVAVGSALAPIAFSQNNISLIPGGRSMTAISGGSASNAIYSNSGSSVVSASLASGGNVVLLTAGAASGAAVITVCPSAIYSNQCAALNVNVPANTAAPAIPAASSGATLYRAEGDSKVYVIKSGKKNWIKSAAEFNAAGYKWSDIIVTTPAKVASYPDAAISNLLRAAGDSKVYVIENGKKRWVQTAAEFNAAGYDWSKISEVAPDDLAVYPSSDTAVIKVKIVNTSALRVRKSNTAAGAILGSVSENEVYTVIQENNGWYKIKTPNEVIGWISGVYALKQ